MYSSVRKLAFYAIGIWAIILKEIFHVFVHFWFLIFQTSANFCSNWKEVGTGKCLLSYLRNETETDKVGRLNSETKSRYKVLISVFVNVWPVFHFNMRSFISRVQLLLWVWRSIVVCLPLLLKKRRYLSWKIVFSSWWWSNLKIFIVS